MTHMAGKAQQCPHTDQEIFEAPHHVCPCGIRWMLYVDDWRPVETVSMLRKDEGPREWGDGNWWGES